MIYLLGLWLFENVLFWSIIKTIRDSRKRSMTFYAVMFPEKHKLDIAENVCVTAFIVISLAFASVVFYVNQYASSSKAILELSALIAVSIGPIIIMVYLMYNIKRLIAILKAREGWSCLWASPLYGPDETDDNNG